MSVRSLRYNTIEQHFTKGVTASTDRDALAFLEAAQIYNTNQQRAIVNLVRSLKRVGLWSKMKAIYPFIGGTATTHKWNLKDPRDVDAAFRLTFSGGWTHASTGALPNGISAYADTKLTPSTELPLADHHASIYLRTNTTGTNLKCDLGSYTTVSVDQYLVIYARFIDRTYMVSGDNSFPFFANTDSRGFYLLAKSANTTLDGYRNLTKSLTAASTSTTGGTRSGARVYLGARNAKNINADIYSDREFAFASLGDDLNDTDATNLYNIVDLYQKRLGRAI